MTNIFTSIGNAFKTGWNNGNISKGLRAAGALSFGVGATGMMISGMKHNQSIFGNECCGGGLYSGFGMTPFSMQNPMAFLNSSYMQPFGMYNNMGMYNTNMYSSYNMFDLNSNQYYLQNQQDDSLAACQTLYGAKYNIVPMGGEYVAVAKDGSGSPIKAATPKELIDKLGTQNTAT